MQTLEMDRSEKHRKRHKSKDKNQTETDILIDKLKTHVTLGNEEVLNVRKINCNIIILHTNCILPISSSLCIKSVIASRVVGVGDP